MKRSRRKTRLKLYNSELNSEDDEDYYPSEEEEEDEFNFSNKYKIKKSNTKICKILDETKKEILKTEPNIMEILKEPLLLQDRANLLQLYEIYKSTDSFTEQSLDIRNKFNKNFIEFKRNYKQYSKYTLQQHDEMKSQIEILESFDPSSDIQYKILQLETDIETKQIIYNKYKELKYMNSNDDEKVKLTNWINWAVSLPYNKIISVDITSNLTRFLKNISSVLDRELYGMKNVKEEILLFVSSKIQNPHMKKCSLGLVGKPGTGKTAISRLLAQILDYPFEQISLGGIQNPDFLKGHDYTYIGAQPGEIVKCMKRMKYKNGILFLDEFDKISDNKDICSALLHITDPVQNSEFKDNFLSEISIDLSYLWFVYSMNELPTDSALRDRIYTVNVPGYSLEDKICIIKDFLFPKALKNINTPEDSIIVKDDIAKIIIEKVSSEDDEGVRSIDKCVNNIVTKIDFLVKHQDKKGKLKGFNMSFDIGKVIKYPLILSGEIIEILI